MSELNTLYDLSDSVPYLINRVGHTVTEKFRTVLDPEAISVPMWRVLAVLSQRGDQRLGELAELTSIELSTLSRQIDNLQERGLVARRRSRRDGRAVRITLTEAGKAIAGRIIPMAEYLDNWLLEGMSDVEVQLLKLLLAKFHQNIVSRLDRKRSA